MISMEKAGPDKLIKQTFPLRFGKYSDRHADYDIIPLNIADGCLYHCKFCCVKTDQKFQKRSKENILQQIVALKDHFGENDFYNTSAVIQHKIKGQLRFGINADPAYLKTPLIIKEMVCICSAKDEIVSQRNKICCFASMRASTSDAEKPGKGMPGVQKKNRPLGPALSGTRT